MAKVNLADVAARIHYDMVTDNRNGYSQGNRWGGQTGQTKTLTINGKKYTYKLGDYDCASSVITAWRIALQGTPYEGKLNGATYTGDMLNAFVNSGLFTSSSSPAKRGDLYLTPKTSYRLGHVAMCQDGGSDGVFGYDSLSEFVSNEYGGATGGKVGDQTGGEAIFRKYYNFNGGWVTVLHYNHKADYEIDTSINQKPGSPVNNYGIKYRVHSQSFGWLPSVRDGQIAGTTGQAKRMEALKITPPDGIELSVTAHIQKIGDKTYNGIKKGANSGTGSSNNDPIIGTVGESKRLEAITIKCTQNPKNLKLRYQGHMQGIGWGKICKEGELCGTRGEARRLEAIKIWFE